jgi:hypothetical protein
MSGAGIVALHRILVPGVELGHRVFIRRGVRPGGTVQSLEGGGRGRPVLLQARGHYTQFLSDLYLVDGLR